MNKTGGMTYIAAQLQRQSRLVLWSPRRRRSRKTHGQHGHSASPPSRRDALGPPVPGTTFSVDGRAQRAVSEHEGVLAAVSTRTPDQAEASTREHMPNAMQTRIEMLALDGVP